MEDMVGVTGQSG